MLLHPGEPDLSIPANTGNFLPTFTRPGNCQVTQRIFREWQDLTKPARGSDALYRERATRRINRG
jgi:hypothetical protein